MHSTCSDFCPSPDPCQLAWFKSPCICMVSAGGVAPTIAVTNAPGAESARGQARTTGAAQR